MINAMRLPGVLRQNMKEEMHSERIKNEFTESLPEEPEPDTALIGQVFS
jgi:hypothetical protein